MKNCSQSHSLETFVEKRSLFNWSSPSAAEIEARRRLIQENVQRLSGVKRKYKKSAQQLQQWQTKQKAFDEWVRSPLNQKIKEAIGYLKQPEFGSDWNMFQRGRGS